MRRNADDASTGASPGPDGAPNPARRARMRRYAVRLALLAAVALLCVALARQWHDVSASFDELTPLNVGAGFVATVAAVGMSVLAWRALLRGLGVRLPLRAAVRVFFVGQLGKYLPIGVGPVLAQMELSKAHGVSRVQSATASMVVLGLAVPTGGLVAAVTLPFGSPTALGRYGWVLAAVPVSLILLHPAVLTWLLNRALRLARRNPLPRPLALRDVIGASGWLSAGYLCYGVGTWCIARDLSPAVGQGRLLLLATGTFALAWTAGFLVLVLPAGAGVREAVIVLAMTPALTGGAATLVAVVVRLLATAADLVWAAVGAAARPTTVEQAAPAGPPAQAAPAGQAAELAQSPPAERPAESGEATGPPAERGEEDTPNPANLPARR